MNSKAKAMVAIVAGTLIATLAFPLLRALGISALFAAIYVGLSAIFIAVIIVVAYRDKRTPEQKKADDERQVRRLDKFLEPTDDPNEPARWVP